jgi:hypothetical protein
MANQEHLDILKQGVGAWNKWRETHPTVKPNLSKAYLYRENLVGFNLMDADLAGANMMYARLKRANLQRAELMGVECRRGMFRHANLQGANLSDARLTKGTFSKADLTGAKLCNARLYGAHLRQAKLCEADLSGANLNYAQISETNLEGAILTNCHIYGISVWKVEGTPAEQSSLVISRKGEATVTVDNIKVAQFIYLLLNNREIRDAIDTIGKKAVLILGRFTAERKGVLDAIREELRKWDYLPILFDFDPLSNRDITETISTLAHMSRFVIADITDAKSIPQELQAIVPNLPSVPVQPLLLATQSEYGMFEHFKRYPWVLKTHIYENQDALLSSLHARVIEPAEAKALELEKSNR